MRTLLVLLLVLVVAALAAVAIVPRFIPSEVYKAQIETHASAALGRAVEVSGPVTVAVLPRVQARAGDVTIANAEGFSAPAFARVEELRAGLAILPLFVGRVEVTEFVLAGPEISLEAAADGRVNWMLGAEVDDAAATPAPAAGEPFQRGRGAVPIDAALGDVRIVDGSARYRDAATGADHAITEIDVAARLPSFAEPFSLEGAFALDGEPFTVAVRLDTLRAFFDGEAAAYRVSIDSDILNVRADGAFAPGADIAFAGEVAVESESLRELAAAAGAELPDGDVYERFRVSGDANGTSQTLAFENAEIVFDALRASGAFQIDLAGAKPVASGRLDTGPLDLTPYAVIESETPGGGTGETPPWSEEPIDLAALSLIDADFELTAQSIRFHSFEVGRSALTVALQNGRLQADVSELTAYGGSGRASVVVNARSATPSFSLQADLAALQAQPFLQAAARFGGLAGAASGELRLTASGRSQAEIMRSLDGGGDFTVADGRLAGVDLAALGSTLAQAVSGDLGAIQAVNVASAFGPGRSTAFEDLAGPFTVSDGVITAPQLKMTAAQAVARLNARLDVGGQALDVRLIPELLRRGADEGGPVDLSRYGLAAKVAGPWNEVTAGLDDEALRAAAGAAARDEVGRVIDRAVGDDVAGDVLRSLIGAPRTGDEDGTAEGEGEAEDGEAEAEPEEDVVDQLLNRLIDR